MSTKRPLGSPLSSEQNDEVAQVGRLLIKIREADIAPKAAKAGLTEKALQEGAALHRAASGIDRPFAHVLSDAQQLVAVASTPGTAERYRAIDDFENLWIPRLRSAIGFFIQPEEKAKEVEAAIFMNLTQQPLGPKVVDSVDLLLTRWAGFLALPGVQGKEALVEALAGMGFTEAAVADMRAKVDAARVDAGAAPAPLVSEADLQAADEKQLAAFVRLQKWYALWAGVLRQSLDYHMRIRLGISEVKGGRKAGSGDPGDGDPTGPVLPEK